MHPFSKLGYFMAIFTLILISYACMFADREIKLTTNFNLNKMARISQGVYGGISGKLGNTIGASWKGIHYLRIKPASVANPNTPKQQDQRLKFITTLKFLQPLHAAVNAGYRRFAVKMSPFNSAFSHTIRNAIAGNFPDYEINYGSALLSRGKLTKAEQPQADCTVTGKVDFSWTPNSTSGNAMITDKAMVVIFNPDKNEAVIRENAATRGDGTVQVDVPATFAGNTVHTWLSFISDDGLVSDSTYAGEVDLA
jgi:hypothetical protein